ncbi:FecR domain-containing protein [Mucilaginibacter sp. R-33]|uniref:FecR family protein n=1 Tax=Mucilaginibacter sp. R-33 TaxID=3416711 RepID=UPI003CE81482
MNDQEIEELMSRYVNGSATEEEAALIERWYMGLAAKEEIPESDRNISQVKAAIWNRIHRRRIVPIYRYAAAAMLLAAIGIGSYSYLEHKKTSAVQTVAVNDVQPGCNKAYLVLGNGQRISLTDAKNGPIANQAGKTIQKTADGTLVYDNSNSSHNSAESIYNAIETPRGGQYQVVLPDGTQVWLNAASSLKYPASFTGTDREVELSGEAYFEVAKDKAHPFRVKTGKETVEVLGTHFNINSYADEPTLKTTLLEGSVKITTASKQQIIKPGEQAVLSNNQLNVQEADIEEVLAWKNGLFVFNDEPLESIMRKVARWYDVDVQYGDIDKTQAFGGGVSRFSNVSKVLQKLESTRMVHFKIQGKTIYVSK